MSTVDQFLQDLGKHSDKVKQSTSPLNHLGVTCFYYVSIKSNGDHILLTDRPEVDEYYYDQKLYFKDPYVRHPDNYKSGLFFFETNQKDEFDQSLAYLAHNFRISPLVGLCEKQKDSVEFFGFWGESNQKHSFESIYLNYAHLLKAFASHFKQKCGSILEEYTAPHLNLTKLIGNDLFEHKSISESKLKYEILRKYLIEIGFGHEVAEAEALSRRERDCMKCLVHGKSAKETAVLLNLSQRTVEHYFENIKRKLDCNFKNELFNRAEKLNELGLI